MCSQVDTVNYFSGGTTMRMICKVLFKESEDQKTQNTICHQLNSPFLQGEIKFC